ncbi:YhzD family protein [Peribacillus muralis]|uniref:YhzD family protein n=1 Tax=Peribacillus muralis TaxID=264697 RepID=UPI003D02DF60
MTKIYKLTVFEPSGEKLLDESFTAENDEQAKELGQTLLNEKNYQDRTHRCISPAGQLLLFHR